MKITANAITTERIDAGAIYAERIRIDDLARPSVAEEKPYRFVYRESPRPAPIVSQPSRAASAVTASHSAPSPYAALAPFALAFLPMMLAG